MDEVAKLRVAFIKDQLARVMTEDDPFKRKLAAREFRRYLEWWGNSLSLQDRREISAQLSRLESMDSVALH